LNPNNQMMLRLLNILLFLLSVASFPFAHANGEGLKQVLSWNELAPIADPVGFASPFAGVVDGSLVVAGGANFPDGRPWEGATKVWHDSVFVLDDPEGDWRPAGRLPRALAYGVSITTPEGLVCIGGSDEQSHYASVFRLRLQSGNAVFDEMPDLPVTMANAAGLLMGDSIYVVGGQEQPNAKPSRQVWKLDLLTSDPKWEELPPLPGAGRMLATVGTLNGDLFVFSGTDLVPQGEPDSLVREYLKDAWRFTPRSGWFRLQDLPEPRVAAPGPAIPMGMAHLLLLGGDTGELAAEIATLKDAHPGFASEILAYHTITNTWTSAGSLPVDPGPDPATEPNLGFWSPVTVPVVDWNGLYVIPSGEARPGVRTPRVLTARPAVERTDVGVVNLVTIALYLGCMLGIGFYFARRERNTDRFFRGGQSVPWWAVGLSIYATMLSSITFMALPAKAYTSDWSYFFANVAIVAIAPIVITYYLPFFRRLDVTSAYEYLEMRFNLAVRLFGSASFILLQIGRMAIVLYLPAIALSTVSSLDVYTCIFLMAILCIVYTMIGGIEAVIWADVVQTFVLLGGAVLSFILIIFKTDGGLGTFFETAQTNGKLFSDTVWISPDLAVASVAVIFFGSLFNNMVSYTAGQDVVQRYMTTSSQEKAARSIWTNAILALPGTVLFFALGTAFFVFYQEHPNKLSTGISNDQILPLFVVRELPVGIAGLVIAGIMAASQSTMSSSLNSVSAAWMTDFHRRLWPGSNDHRHLRMAQGVILVTGAFSTGVACIMAQMGIASLFDAFISIIGMTGGALAGLFALGIFTRKANGAGALTGAVVSVGFLLGIKAYTSLNFFMFGCIGMVTCMMVGYLVSCFLGKHSQPLSGLTIHDTSKG
jgi:SSS family transporter